MNFLAEKIPRDSVIISGSANDDDAFLDPGKLRWRFTLRKRKRRKDNLDCGGASASVSDLSRVSTSDCPKKVKRLSRVSSLVALLPHSSRPVMKVGEALQRTWSGVKLSSSPMAIGTPPPQPCESQPASPSSSPGKICGFSPPKRAAPGPCRQRGSRLWTQTVATESGNLNLSDIEIQLQEAIFELYQGEEDMVEDLLLVKSAYHDSLRHLNIMTAKELQNIFGSMHTLTPLHQDLVDKMKRLRNDDGTTDSIGAVLLEWIPGLTLYIAYCANQVHAKALLDEKKNHDKRLEDFLQRCLESPFSRRLDLWNFLDVPRSRLVKYPLLFKNILKLTPKGHPDETLITAAINMVEEIIRKVDEKTGEAESKLIISKLDYLEDKQRDPLIATSSVLLCSGVLRNTRGTKLNVFLFNGILVLTRPASRDHHGLMYQVYRQPIPAHQLVVEDLKDGEVKMGSFRNAFSHNQTAKNLFRVSFRDPSQGQAHTLQANDSHDKKQWLHNLRKVSGQQGAPSPCSSPNAAAAGGGATSAAATAALLTACHQQQQEQHNQRHNMNNAILSAPTPPRVLRKRSSDNSLQVASIEAACRGSLACLFTAETHSHTGHSTATTLFV